MKRIAWISFCLVVLTPASPLWACGGEQFHDYVLLDDPPPEKPAGTILLKVLAPRPKQALPLPPPPVDGVIENMPGTALEGRSVTIRMNGWSSCTYWAESATASYTVGRLREDGGRLSFEPRVFLGAHGRSMEALDRSLKSKEK